MVEQGVSNSEQGDKFFTTNQDSVLENNPFHQKFLQDQQRRELLYEANQTNVDQADFSTQYQGNGVSKMASPKVDQSQLRQVIEQAQKYRGEKSKAEKIQAKRRFQQSQRQQEIKHNAYKRRKKKRGRVYDSKENY
jgi:hypothetical protein